MKALGFIFAFALSVQPSFGTENLHPSRAAALMACVNKIASSLNSVYPALEYRGFTGKILEAQALPVNEVLVRRGWLDYGFQPVEQALGRTSIFGFTAQVQEPQKSPTNRVGQIMGVTFDRMRELRNAGAVQSLLVRCRARQVVLYNEAGKVLWQIHEDLTTSLRYDLD